MSFLATPEKIMTHDELMKRAPQWLADGRARVNGVTLYESSKCHFCGKDCWTVSSDLRRKGMGFCDVTCVGGWRGKIAREGRKVNQHGYVVVRRPDHPNATTNGYVLEHRLVMAEFLGRPLEAGEVVHHRDGDKTNNAVENLEVLPGHSEHNRVHGRIVDLAVLTRHGVRNCTKCGAVKPLSEFARSRKQLHGYMSQCNACRHDHYIATNPQRQRAPDALRERHRRRWEASEDYRLVQAGQRRCKTCDEVKALGDFHRHPHCLAGHAYYCKTCDSARRRAAGYKKKAKCK